ncbi:hypothetical protein HN873_007113 [Arachis hypogaea]
MTSTSQVITCKAVVCWKVGEGVKIEKIQVDPPKSTEVRLKMLCSSICHTDISSIQGTPMFNFYPLALGHEGVGVVESVGDEVKSVKGGDMVIPIFVGECKECENCISGKSNLCMTYPMSLTGLMPDNTSRMSCRGQRLYHPLSCATWSETPSTRLSMLTTLLRLIQALIQLMAASSHVGSQLAMELHGRKPRLKVDQVLLSLVLVLLD